MLGVCLNPLTYNTCLTLVFPPLFVLSLSPIYLLFLSSSFFMWNFVPPFYVVYSPYPVPDLSHSVFSLPLSLLLLAQTSKTFRTIRIDTWVPQRTNALAISPQPLLVPWQPLHPLAHCATRGACSRSQASRSASCLHLEERRQSKDSR